MEGGGKGMLVVLRGVEVWGKGGGGRREKQKRQFGGGEGGIYLEIGRAHV